jgi:nucleotide-binding universal stress UspA family protein
MTTVARDGAPVVLVPVLGGAQTRVATSWAADYVASRGGTLLLLGTWPGLVRYGLPPWTVTYDPEPVAREAVEEAALDAALEPEQVRTELVRGDTGRILAARSRDVDLIVLGHRPGPPVLDSLLGSLSDHCIRHAACPVVVVPVDQPQRSTAVVGTRPRAARPQPAAALIWSRCPHPG